MVLNQSARDADPRTHGLWGRTARDFKGTRLQSSVAATVAVIGGGYTGLSAALHLLNLGASVCVLEAQDIGYGGSGRNVGLVNAGLWLPPDNIVESLGRETGSQLISLLGEAPNLVFQLIKEHGIDCDALQNGTLHCAVGSRGAKDLQSRWSQWSALGAPVELLSREATCERTGSPAFALSLLDKRAGTIQPLSYACGLATAVQARGGRIHVQSPAVRVERSGERWKVSTPEGQVDADWIILATDAYSRGPWTEIAQEQVFLPYFNFATAPMAPSVEPTVLPGKNGAWDTQSILTSFRKDRDGRLVFGSVGALRGAGIRVHRAFAKRALRTLFPQLQSVEFEHEWYGSIGMTSDNIPRFHQWAPRVVSVSGYNGRGIGPGTTFGRLLAQYIVGAISEERIPLPCSGFRAAGNRWLKSTLYEYGSVLAHLIARR